MVIAISMLKKESYWKVSKRDLICGAMAIVALVLWYLTKKPIIAILFSILSDFLASIPTVIKAWQNPETEPSFAYITSAISMLTSFFAIQEWNFESVSFPIYIVTMNVIIILSIERKRFKKGVA